MVVISIFLTLPLFVLPDKVYIDVPADSKEIRDVQNNNGQFEGRHEEVEENEACDVVIVLDHVFCFIFVVLDDLVEPIFVQNFHLFHQGRYTEDLESVV